MSSPRRFGIVVLLTSALLAAATLLFHVQNQAVSQTPDILGEDFRLVFNSSLSYLSHSQ
jgi:hypothetical protein